MQGAGCEVQGAGCEVQGAECGVQGAECGVQGAECGVRSAGFGVRGSEGVQRVCEARAEGVRGAAAERSSPSWSCARGDGAAVWVRARPTSSRRG